MNDLQAKPAPTVQIGVLHQQVADDRAIIEVDLVRLNGDRMVLVDKRAAAIAEIARLEALVTECDASIASYDQSREDLLAMDDALADQQRALERLLVRRAGR